MNEYQCMLRLHGLLAMLPLTSRWPRMSIMIRAASVTPCSSPRLSQRGLQAKYALSRSQAHRHVALLTWLVGRLDIDVEPKWQLHTGIRSTTAFKEFVRARSRDLRAVPMMIRRCAPYRVRFSASWQWRFRNGANAPWNVPRARCISRPLPPCTCRFLLR